MSMEKWMRNFIKIIGILVLGGVLLTGRAQEVVIPDAGLNAAIREELKKAGGPLTVEDMLSLTNLTARNRNISRVEGLETARGLRLLDLQQNHLGNFSLPSTLTELRFLDVSLNGLTNCAIPSDLTNLMIVIAEGNGLTNIDLPSGL